MSRLQAEYNRMSRDRLYITDYSDVDWDNPLSASNPVLAAGESDFQDELDERIRDILKEEAENDPDS